MHCVDICSLIENVDILGVAIGDVVKKGQDIATAKEGYSFVGWTLNGEIVDFDKFIKFKIHVISRRNM